MTAVGVRRGIGEEVVRTLARLREGRARVAFLVAGIAEARAWPEAYLAAVALETAGWVDEKVPPSLINHQVIVHVFSQNRMSADVSKSFFTSCEIGCRQTLARVAGGARWPAWVALDTEG